MKKFFQLLYISKKNKHLKLAFFFIFLLFLPFLEMLGVGLIIPVISNIQDSVYQNNLINQVNSLFNYFLKIFIEDELAKKNRIYFSVILFTGVILMKVIIFVFFNFFKSKIIYDLQMLLTDSLCKKTFSKSYLYFANRNSSLLIRDLQNEINIVAHYMESFLLLTTELLIVIFILIFLFIYNWHITSLILVIYSIAMLIYFFFGKKRIKKWSEKRLIFDGLRLRYLDEILNSIKEIKIFQKENYFINRYKYYTDKAYKISKYLSIYNNNIRYWFEFSALILIIFIINYYLNSLKNIDEIILTLGVLFYIVTRIAPSFIKIFSSYNNIKIYSVSVKNILSYFKQESLEFEEFRFGDLKVNKIENISLNDLSFKYPNSQKLALRNTSFVFKKGEISGIVGKSGSGKSTLVNLLAGIIKARDGSILLNNNISFNKIDIKSFRKKIGYVSQQTFILDEDLEKNIAFGVKYDEINSLKVEKCIKKAELRDMQGKLLDSNTKTGQKGSMISVGQQQRLGIARALYFEPDIIIMDEPTSSLDAETGQKIMNTFLKLKQDLIIIIVTHDKNLAKIFDKVLELK